MLGNLAQTYWKRCNDILSEIYQKEQESMHQAATLISETILNGGQVHLWDTGHTIGRELVNRAGGMMDMTPLEFDLHITNEIAYEPIIRQNIELSEEAIKGFVSYALAHSHLKAGDVLIIGSVTGARAIVIEVALQASAMGVKLIGLTSRNYSSFVNAKHSSGKKLYDICDVVIDNTCEVGDAIVPVPELDGNIGPTTGISAAMLMWLVVSEVVELLINNGKIPKMFVSMNLPGAMDRNQKIVSQFKK